MIKLSDILKQILLEEKKKADRCLRIARRKYKKSSAYRSGAIERCRQGDIWKDLKESNENFQLNIINNIFESNPELASIGNEEQYSQYLDTIFPDSQVKDIVSHNSPNKFEKFNVNRGRLGVGVYFGLGYKIYNTGQYNYNALLNIKNLKRYDKGEFVITANKLYPSQDQYSTKPQDTLRTADEASGIDGYVSTSPVGTEFLIFEPEQIHILGSKQDIEGFKKYVNVLTEVKKETLRTWFKRQGPKGKEGGWVDCNTCKDGSCKACGRKKGEKRTNYPSCQPTPAKCKTPGKGKKWGKTK